MSDIQAIFKQLGSRYQCDAIEKPLSYYFSIGPHKYTLFARTDGFDLKEGKATQQADCVVVTTPSIFTNLVLHGKHPGKLDVIRGRFKVSSLPNLMKLEKLFGLK